MTTIESDPLGRPTRTTLPSGLGVTRTYAANGALGSIDVGKARWSAVADPAADTIRYVDAAGAATRITRDAFGRIAAVTLPGGGQERRRYDADGLIERSRSPRTRSWRFAYGPDAALREIGFPGGGSERFEYDAAGRMAGLTYPWGGKVSFRYDSRPDRRARRRRRAPHRVPP